MPKQISVTFFSLSILFLIPSLEMILIAFPFSKKLNAASPHQEGNGFRTNNAFWYSFLQKEFNNIWSFLKELL